MEGSPRRFRLCSTATPPLEDDDLLTEILLRLHPNPSSLPRASAVCKRWLGIVSDPGFLRRHRRKAPILGCFRTELRLPRISFVPTLEPPDRVPAERFSLQLDNNDGFGFRALNCRHDVVLVYLRYRKEFLVWDPVTGEQHPLPVPPRFVREEERIDGAVLRAAGAVHSFQVVLVGFDQNDRKRAIACVYSSDTGVWGNLVSTRLPNEVLADPTFMGVPAVLAGDSLYWFITGGSSRVLGFDLHSQKLAVMPVPVEKKKEDEDRRQVMFVPAEGGGLGFLTKSGYKVQVWNSDGVASWALGRTIELDKLLPLDPKEEDSSLILGYAESSNVLFLWTDIGHFMVQLEPLKYEKIFDTTTLKLHQPFECVYTGGV